MNTAGGSADAAPLLALSLEESRELLARFVADGDGAARLKHRPRDSAVYRIPALDGSHTVILKVWRRTGLRSRLRILLRTSPLLREVAGMNLMRSCGIPGPQPLARLSFERSSPIWTHALFMEDLGECRMAVDHIRELVANQRHDEVRSFAAQVIGMTTAMVRRGILDIDHGFVNIVTRAAGTPVRVDFEQVRLVRWVSLFPALYARMLSRLVSSFTYGVQPEVGLAEQFAVQLQAALSPPRRVLLRAADLVSAGMERQNRDTGIDTRLDLPWR